MLQHSILVKLGCLGVGEEGAKLVKVALGKVPSALLDHVVTARVCQAASDSLHGEAICIMLRRKRHSTGFECVRVRFDRLPFLGLHPGGKGRKSRGHTSVSGRHPCRT